MYGRGHSSVRFGPAATPNVIKQLMILNVGVSIAQHLLPGQLEPWLAARPDLFWERGAFWQPFTYMFLHAPGLMHIAFNMLALWMFGSPVASAWGERRFLRFYLLCGLGAGFIIVTWPALVELWAPGTRSYVTPTLGASGAVFGVLLAYSLIWPDRQIMLLFPPIPIRAMYFIPLILFMEWIYGPSNVSHVGHLGGVLVGWILFRRASGNSLLPTTARLKHRWRRYRMRQKLRAVRNEDERWRGKSDDDLTLH